MVFPHQLGHRCHSWCEVAPDQSSDSQNPGSASRMVQTCCCGSQHGKKSLVQIEMYPMLPLPDVFRDHVSNKLVLMSFQKMCLETVKGCLASNVYEL